MGRVLPGPVGTECAEARDAAEGPPRTGCALAKIYVAPNVNSARLGGPARGGGLRE